MPLPEEARQLALDAMCEILADENAETHEKLNAANLILTATAGTPNTFLTANVNTRQMPPYA